MDSEKAYMADEIVSEKHEKSTTALKEKLASVLICLTIFAFAYSISYWRTAGSLYAQSLEWRLVPKSLQELSMEEATRRAAVLLGTDQAELLFYTIYEPFFIFGALVHLASLIILLRMQKPGETWKTLLRGKSLGCIVWIAFGIAVLCGFPLAKYTQTLLQYFGDCCESVMGLTSVTAFIWASMVFLIKLARYVIVVFIVQLPLLAVHWVGYGATWLLSNWMNAGVAASLVVSGIAFLFCFIPFLFAIAITISEEDEAYETAAVSLNFWATVFLAFTFYA